MLAKETSLLATTKSDPAQQAIGQGYIYFVQRWWRLVEIAIALPAENAPA